MANMPVERNINQPIHAIAVEKEISKKLDRIQADLNHIKKSLDAKEDLEALNAAEEDYMRGRTKRL